VTTAFPCNSLMAASDTSATATVATSDYRPITAIYDVPLSLWPDLDR